MGADKKVSAPTERSKELDAIQELQQELHDRIVEAHALISALASISALTELTERSLGRLRHMIICAESSAVEAMGLSADLGDALQGPET